MTGLMHTRMGQIVDQDGLIESQQGEFLGHERMRDVDWLVEGVGGEPQGHGMRGHRRHGCGTPYHWRDQGERLEAVGQGHDSGYACNGDRSTSARSAR